MRSQERAALPLITFVTGTREMWGAEASLLDLARGLRAVGGARVALLTSNSELAGVWSSEDPSSVSLIDARPGRFARVGGFVRGLSGVPRGSTVVVFDHYLIPAVVLARPLLTARRVRLVFDLHDSALFSRKRRVYFALIRAFHAVVAVSSYVLDQVPSGVKGDVVFRPLADPGRAPRRQADSATVGIIGQIAPHKRVAEAVQIAADAGVERIVLRGSAPDVVADYLDEVLERGRAQAGAGFAFEGKVPHDAVLDGVDILLFMNPDEPSGRVVAEAQYAGVVAVVPDRGGVIDFVVDGVTGIHFDPDDRHAAAELLASVAADRELRERLASAALEHARLAYSLEGQARTYRDVVLGQPVAT